jgi:hypothetical protein
MPNEVAIQSERFPTPEKWGAIMQISEELSKSKALPACIQNPAQLTMVLLAGRESGMGVIESLNAYVPCRIRGDAHRAAFLICDCCGAAREFEPGLDAGLAAAAEAGYSVRSLTLEARGLCPACRAA